MYSLYPEFQTVSAQALFRYWSERAEKTGIPHRCTIEPIDLKSSLRDIFILESTHEGAFIFRVAGTRLNALFQTELKDQDFLSYFSGSERKRLQVGLTGVTQKGDISTFSLTLKHQNAPLPFEGLCLPLRSYNSNRYRLIGVLSPQTLPEWAGHEKPEISKLENMILWDNPYKINLHAPEDQVFFNSDENESYRMERTGKHFPKLADVNRVLLRRKHLVLIEGGLAQK